MASKLIVEAPYEAENQLECSLRQAFESLQPNLRSPFSFSLSIPTPDQYSQLNRAILHGILAEPHFAKTHIKHLHGIITDGYAMFINLLIKVVHQLYPKLLGSVKSQLLWVAEEMINVLRIGFDAFLVSFLRQINGGDFSDGNWWLCLKMATLFLDKWQCLLEEEPDVLSCALYVFLRVLADHCRPNRPIDKNFETLRRLEVHLCVKIIREEFHLCLRIGRDFVKLLQDLIHVPEFRDIWKDLMLCTSKFNTSRYVNVSQLYHTTTCSKYVLLRINPQMETKLRFLMTYVKMGQQKRHQVWFFHKFLVEPDRETVIVDIVRFICCAHHPPNKIIQSDIVPRWAVIGWLLKSCRSSYVERSVKLALFYDWLFLDERVGNVMNIEPAILLMVHSVQKYIDTTHNLLEFLLHLVDNYDVQVENKGLIAKGVSSALQLLAKKGVIQSFDVLTRCPTLLPSLKEGLERLLSGVKKLGCSNGVMPNLSFI